MQTLEEPTPARIRSILKARGWTQVHASELLGISPVTFRRYVQESGKSKLKMPRPVWTLLLLYAGMHPQYLLTPRSIFEVHPPVGTTDD